MPAHLKNALKKTMYEISRMRVFVNHHTLCDYFIVLLILTHIFQNILLE